MAEPIEDTFHSDRYHPDNIARDRRLTEHAVRAHSIMTSALADLMSAVAEAEEFESYWAQGAQSCSEWLVANLRIHGKTARTWTRMAKNLRDYPEFREKMAEGVLGFDQIRELLKYVDPENAGDVAEVAMHEPAEQLESEARAARRVTPDRVEKVRNDRWYEYFFDHEELTYSFRGEIPGQDGLIVHQAMQLLAWNAPEEPVYDVSREPEHRLADALVEMASNALANRSNHDISTIVVHADASLLHLADRVGVAEFGTDVPMEAIRRLTCDGRLQLVAHGDDGCVVGVGRVTRSIPPWLRRLVRMRDKGCRFPGCRRTHWTQIHHIIHWAYGGPTDLDNLITLCGFHHRMLHEDRWSVTGDPAGQLAWLLPGGSRYERTPGHRPWEESREMDIGYIHDWAMEHHLVKPGPG